jgi:hypothetical protein
MTKINKEIKIADTPSKEKGKQRMSKAEKVKGVKQKVVEESADVVHLVLPQNLKADNGGCIGCDGVGGCGFCECKSNISDQVQNKNSLKIKNKVQTKNKEQIKNKIQR